MTDRGRFAKIMAILSRTFRAEVDDLATQGYWLGLSDVSDDEAERAMVRALAECEFMPAPMVLRRFAKVARDGVFCSGCHTRPCECKLLASLPDKPDPRISEAIRADMQALHEHLKPKGDA